MPPRRTHSAPLAGMSRCVLIVRVLRRPAAVAGRFPASIASLVHCLPLRSTAGTAPPLHRSAAPTAISSTARESAAHAVIISGAREQPRRRRRRRRRRRQGWAVYRGPKTKRRAASGDPDASQVGPYRASSRRPLLRWSRESPGGTGRHPSSDDAPALVAGTAH